MKDIPHTLKLVTIWLLLGLGLFLGVQAWQAQQARSRFHAADGVIELQRAPDGHFHWPGRVNGVAVDFMVDTGATRTALPAALAGPAGLQPQGTIRSDTAGGEVQGQVARATIELDGGVRAERLPVALLPVLSTPLLGMDVLSRMRFSQSDGVLRLEPAAGSAP
jgi:aspartyl protease family protein